MYAPEWQSIPQPLKGKRCGPCVGEVAFSVPQPHPDPQLLGSSGNGTVAWKLIRTDLIIGPVPLWFPSLRLHATMEVGGEKAATLP